MDSTVHPERNDADAISIIPAASSTGFIITPPPIPQIEPATDEKKQTRKIIQIVIIINLSFFYKYKKKRGKCYFRSCFLYGFFCFFMLLKRTPLIGKLFCNAFHFGQTSAKEHLIRLAKTISSICPCRRHPMPAASAPA